MKLYLKQGNILKIDKNLSLELLNSDEFISIIKKNSSATCNSNTKI